MVGKKRFVYNSAFVMRCPSQVQVIRQHLPTCCTCMCTVPSGSEPDASAGARPSLHIQNTKTLFSYFDFLTINNKIICPCLCGSDAAKPSETQREKNFSGNYFQDNNWDGARSMVSENMSPLLYMTITKITTTITAMSGSYPRSPPPAVECPCRLRLPRPPRSCVSAWLARRTWTAALSLGWRRHGCLTALRTTRN